jgi:hypothetical protein
MKRGTFLRSLAALVAAPVVIKAEPKKADEPAEHPQQCANKSGKIVGMCLVDNRHGDITAEIVRERMLQELQIMRSNIYTWPIE